MMEIVSACENSVTSNRLHLALYIPEACHIRTRRLENRIKEFVGPRHFSLLGPFGDSKFIVGTSVYSRLSGLVEGVGLHG
jgi:hypothetical protein